MIDISFEKTPGQDAIAASRERCTQMQEGSPWFKPLRPVGYSAMDRPLSYSSHDKHDADGNLVKVRKTTDGTLVVSFLVDTSDPDEPYVVGPGSWDYLIRMKAIKRGGEMESDHVLEISTNKTTVKVVDDPDFTAKLLLPAEKKPR
jgi:hypothetical protein